MKQIETIINIEFPFKRIPATNPKWIKSFPWHVRYLGWLFSWGGGSVQEFGTGARINKTRHLQLFRHHVLTIHRNEYHDRSDKERADEYLRKWSACEKELRMFRLAALGEQCSNEVKQVIKESLGVDLDEGTTR